MEYLTTINSTDSYTTTTTGLNESFTLEGLTTDYWSEDSNSTKCPNTNPTFISYMTGMSVGFLIINAVLALLTILVLIVYVDELLFLYSKSNRRLQRHKAKWLLGIYPLTSVTAFISLLAPRTSGMNDLVTSIYVALCVYIFVVMVIEEYGGPRRMMMRLNGSQLNPAMLRPWCICFKCFPTVQVTNTTLQVLHAMIMQYVLVRPFLGYIITLMWVDDSFGYSNLVTGTLIQTVLGYISSLSSLLAIWSFAMLYQLCRVPLGNLQIEGKFICLQLVLLITGIQRSIINIFVQTGLITCRDNLTSAAVADRWNHMFMILEILAISICARKIYKDSMLKRIKFMEESVAPNQPVSNQPYTSLESVIDVDL